MAGLGAAAEAHFWPKNLHFFYATLIHTVDLWINGGECSRAVGVLVFLSAYMPCLESECQLGPVKSPMQNLQQVDLLWSTGEWSAAVWSTGGAVGAFQAEPSSGPRAMGTPPSLCSTSFSSQSLNHSHR